MKIYYIANVRIPTEKAHGLQIMKMCEAFALGGEAIELLVPGRLNKIKSDPFDYYGVKRIFKIKKLPCFDLICLDFILGNWAFWVQCLSFLLVARFFLFFREPGIVYTREDLAGFFFKNFFLEIHSLPEKVKGWHKKNWRRAQKLFVLTQHIKNGLVDLGIARDDILVVPDGVDLEEFDVRISKQEARLKIGLPPNRKIIYYVGSFYLASGWKGIDVLLEAVRLLPPDCLTILTGGKEKELAQIRKAYDLENVVLTGYQSRRQVPLYMKAADVLVLPNKKGRAISEKYTSPMKMFEYMAAGRPIVASDLPSIREVLNENNAVLVTPNKPEEIARGIEIILANSDFGDKIARQAFVDVAQKYTWERRARDIINFIKTQ